jgi:undecaprenyl-diphosphatase
MNTTIKSSSKKIAFKLLSKIDFKVFISILIIIIGTTFFIILANNVSAGNTKSFDHWAMEVFRQPDNPTQSIGNELVTSSVRDITALGSGVVIILFTLAVLGFLLFQKKYIMFYLILGATLGGGLLGFLLKEIFGRERPNLIYHLMPATSLSFPSGHSMMSMVLYLSFAALLIRIPYNRSIKIYIISIALFLSIIIGISRIYLGVHYATDVLAGWSIGLAWASFCWLFAQYLEQKKNKKVT